jgi:TolA-binding protein
MFNKKIFASILFLFLATLSAQDISTGVKLIKNEKYSESQKYFSTLLYSGSKSEAYFYLGEIYFIREKVDSAKICYLRGIETNTEFACTRWQ